MGAVWGLTLLYLLVEFGGLHYLGAYVLIFFITVTHNYTLNSLWTFRGREANPVGYVRYSLTSASTLAIRLGLIALMVEVLGMWYMASAIVAIGIGFGINYLISRRWVWRKSRLELA